MMEQDTVLRDAAVPMYAAVHILGNPFCIDGAYHYFIPHFMVSSVRRGAFVSVPFGQGNRKQLGVVVSVGDASALPRDLMPEKIKPLEGVCREKLFLNEKQLALCFYLKETTLCTMGDAVRTVVPASALATLVEYYLPLSEDERSEARRNALSAQDLMVLEYIRSRGSAALRCGRFWRCQPSR